MKNRSGVCRFGVLLLLVSLIPFLIYFYCFPVYNTKYIDNVVIKDYDKKSGITTVLINFDNSFSGVKCGFSDGKDINWVNISGNSCEYAIKNNSLKYVYLKKGIFKSKTKLDSLVVDVELPSKMYLSKGEKRKLNFTSKYIGEELNIVYKTSDNEIVSVSNDIINGLRVGNAKVDVYINNKKHGTFNVIVTDLINERTEKINNKKSYLPCKEYDKEDAMLLDEILEFKIKEAGYGTRAGVVEAGRFLALDFKYKIDYFFENGRLSGGQNYVDGEGRYYHKGLYLDKSKFSEIEKTFSGPAIWGCPLMNYEDYGDKYVKGTYNSNGLDCSGFVSWVFLNAGFDIGDRGSGDNEKDDTEINDVGGEKVKPTDELMKSNKVKAGDMIGYWGHIGLIIGVDDKNIYVAETLWTFGGLVVNSYSKDKVDEEFTQIILMDDFYNEDGKYTPMWY